MKTSQEIEGNFVKNISYCSFVALESLVIGTIYLKI